MTSWQVLPGFIVRPAGFAFERLAPLRFERTVAAVAELTRASVERAEAGTAFDQAVSAERYGSLPEFDDAAVRKQFSKHIKRARAFARGEGADLPADSMAEIVRVLPHLSTFAERVRACHDQVTTAKRAVETAFAEELDSKRSTLRSIFSGDERLQEAVFIESAEAFDRIQQLIGNDGPRDARARQRERLAMMYLQRFCAKNDTNSICGPHAVGWLREDSTTPHISIDAAGETRRTYFSHWAAESLLAEASRRAGEAAVVPYRVNPTARLTGSSIAWCAIEHDATVQFRRRYARANLPGAGVALVRMLQQAPRPLAQLEAAAHELETTPEELRELVDEMVAAGILMRHVALPPGLFHPLRAVIDTVAAWPEPHQEAVAWATDRARGLDGLASSFAAAPLQDRLTIYRDMVDRFSEATGEAAERGQGKHYADRSILHEDCHATIRAEIGAETVEPLLAGLAPLVTAASLPLELARENIRQWFRERFGDGQRVPVLEAHRAFDDERADTRVATTDTAERLRGHIERVRACLANAVDTHADGVARISSSALAQAVAGAPGTARPGYISADLMFARTGATLELVLGEVHGFFWLPTSLLDVVPQPAQERVVASMREAVRRLANGRRTAECLFAHTQATDRRFAIADEDLLLLEHGGRPSVSLGQLDMVLEGDDFKFLDGEREVVPITTYTTYPFLLYTSPLAALINDYVDKFFPDSLLPESARVGDTPRVAIDNLTFRRRTWRRSASELQSGLAGKDAALFTHAQRLRDSLQCPRVVFVSLSTEPKPVLLDFDNFFLVESFAHLIERQPPQAVVRISEMLPGPAELLAEGPDGRRTSELRMGLYRLGPA